MVILIGVIYRYKIARVPLSAVANVRLRRSRSVGKIRFGLFLSLFVRFLIGLLFS